MMREWRCSRRFFMARSARLLLYLACLLSASLSTSSAYADSPYGAINKYHHALWRSGFDESVTINTRLTLMCRYPGGHEIVFYDFANPESQHGHQDVIVFTHGRYSHHYSDLSVNRCACRHDNLICVSDQFTETVPLRDIVSGKQVLLSGNFTQAYFQRKQRGVSKPVRP